MRQICEKVCAGTHCEVTHDPKSLEITLFYMYVCMYVQWGTVDLCPPPPPLYSDTPHSNAQVQVHQTNSRAVSLKIILASVAYHRLWDS